MTIKNLFFAFLFLIQTLAANAQTNFRVELKIKEQFDDFFNAQFHPDLFNIDIIHYTPAQTYDQTQEFGTDMWTGNVGDALQSLITMYEVTGDKGYLIKFME